MSSRANAWGYCLTSCPGTLLLLLRSQSVTCEVGEGTGLMDQEGWRKRCWDKLEP